MLFFGGEIFSASSNVDPIFDSFGALITACKITKDITNE